MGTVRLEEIFLEDFERIVDKKPIIFLPLGTTEWHGDHLPLGTDGLTAYEICKKVAKKTGGTVMPPLFFGTATTHKVKNRLFQGMDAQFGHRLPGSIYYLTPTLFKKTLLEVINQIRLQRFRVLVLLSGHWSVTQRKILRSMPDKRGELKIIKPNVVQYLQRIRNAKHADELEASFLIALRPDLKKKIIMKHDNLLWKQLYGYDPVSNIKLQEGKKAVQLALSGLTKKIKSSL
ncbi:MAG: creatininase family protein [Patescibacteria group bacterium]